MSRFKKLSHTIWHCHYHVVLDTDIPVSDSCRFGKAGSIQLYQCFFGAEEVRSSGVERPALSRSLDSVDTAKLSASNYVGMVKGRSAKRVLHRFKKLRRKPNWVRPEKLV